MASIVSGFRYLFGIHMGISRGPVDELVEIKVGDKTAWRGSATGNSTITIDAYNLFGGEEGEGGIQGDLTLMFGGPAQTAPPALAAVLSQPMPGFRGRFTAFFDGILTMMNPYPKPWKFRVRRAANGWDGGCWYPEKVVIPILRPTSAGETGNSTETSNVTVVETVPAVFSGLFLTATINPTGTLVSITSITSGVSSSGDGQNPVYDAASGAWTTTSSNYTSTFETLQATPSGPNFVVTISPPGTPVIVDGIRVDVDQGGDNGTIPVFYDAQSGVWSITGNVITILPGYGVTALNGVVYVSYQYLVPGSGDAGSPNVIRILSGGFQAGDNVVVTYVQTVTTTSPGGSGTGTALIKAMNPAHMIYECLTNREWGRGLPRSALDDGSFRVVADILATEGFGLCMRWTRRDEIKSFIRSILDHITGALYIDRTTGKLALKLARQDYTASSLPLFNSETGLLEITDADVSAAGSSPINEVRVVWRDPVTDEERTARAVNLGARQASGGVSNSTTYSFTGIPSEELAQRVAKRQLNVVSRSLRRFNVTLDRRGYALVPNGVFRIQDGPRNIRDMVVRIASISYGSLSDGRIRATVVQDEFGLPSRGLSPLPPKPWEPPNNNPCVAEHRVFELPYRSVYRALTAGEFAAVTETTGYIGAVSKEGNPLNAVYDMAVRPGAVESEDWPADDEYYCGYTPPP